MQIMELSKNTCWAWYPLITSVIRIYFYIDDRGRGLKLYSNWPQLLKWGMNNKLAKSCFAYHCNTFYWLMLQAKYAIPDCSLAEIVLVQPSKLPQKYSFLVHSREKIYKLRNYYFWASEKNVLVFLISQLNLIQIFCMYRHIETKFSAFLNERRSE